MDCADMFYTGTFCCVMLASVHGHCQCIDVQCKARVGVHVQNIHSALVPAQLYAYISLCVGGSYRSFC